VAWGIHPIWRNVVLQSVIWRNDVGPILGYPAATCAQSDWSDYRTHLKVIDAAGENFKWVSNEIVPIHALSDLHSLIHQKTLNVT